MTNQANARLAARAAKSIGTRARRGADDKRGDAQQIDIGTYILHQGEDYVGELFVEVDPNDPYNADRRIEHWCFNTTFAAPSSSNSDDAIQFTYATGQDSSLQDFLDRMDQSIPGAKYIKATCEETTL